MAHERLRFNIVLKEQDEPDENRQNNTSFDPIYSDIKYNTHYGIFANFTGVKSNDQFVTSNIHFWLQNYTGDVSIGLTKIIAITDHDELRTTDDYYVNGFSTGRHFKVYLMLQGLSNNFEADYSTPITFTEGDFIEVIPVFEPIENSLSQIKEPASIRNKNSRFVDSEFMIRDGEDIVPNSGLHARLLEIDALKTQGLPGTTNPLIHQGARRTCKMKVSDIYIR